MIASTFVSREFLRLTLAAVTYPFPPPLARHETRACCHGPYTRAAENVRVTGEPRQFGSEYVLIDRS